MQTFVPEKTIPGCVRVLDPMRLNNQVNEAATLIRTLTHLHEGWKNHPAAHMWRDCVSALAVYGMACAVKHAQKDPRVRFFTQFIHSGPISLPWWWAHNSVQVSHRLNLWYKDPNYYTQYKRPSCDVESKPPYVWPIHHDEYEDLSVGPPPYEDCPDTIPAAVTLTRYARPRRVVGVALVDHGAHVVYVPDPKTGQTTGYLLQPKP